MPYVDLINKEYAKLQSISDDHLRDKTKELQDYIDACLKEIDDNVFSLHQSIKDNPEMNINTKEETFSQIDELEKNRNKELESILMEILPLAFAVVKETARRFKENGKLVVEAQMFDQLYAVNKSNVEISEGKATWYNKWTVAKVEITWDMLHYDVQLIGGIVLHQGKIAEMATGEGKTLVATLPSYLNALARRGVHIVTVNDYLARRDSEWMAPLMEFHGLKVDCIDKYEPHSDERKAAYNADITYGTNNEFGFDYLRDNMAKNKEEQVQRKHHYAMVDEVDSVLIDDARTPLIISGSVEKGDEHEFEVLTPRISKLVEKQKKLASYFLKEAKKLITDGNTEDGGLALFRAFRGFPKYKPLIKYLSEPGMKKILQKTENYYLQDSSKKMPEADKPLLFIIEEKQNSIDLTEKGIELITQTGEDKEFFILPDISVTITDIEKDESLADHDKLEKKEALISEYTSKTQRIHTVNQLLKAYTLFEKDVDYIIVEEEKTKKVKIVDEQTGRVMEGRRYSDGLHQALEAKENVKIEDATQTYATVTLQNFFRMYHKLAGMTGTAETEEGEFWEIYKLEVVVIPTNKPVVRDDTQDKVYKTIREKFSAVTDEIQTLVQGGRPVLVGTTSVEISEILSRMLNFKTISHQVLNAKQHAREADVVATAGLPGTVTIATNMAGRGTDIKLHPDSKKAGGLSIIGTERHESRRVDRQLRGRAGRQGDDGSSQFFVSLEDNLMRLFGSDRIAKIMDRIGYDEGEVIQHSMITKSIERAQKKVEENNFGSRKRLLEFDNVMNAQREVIYKRRRNALYGERLQLDIMNMFYTVAQTVVENTQGDFEGFKLETLRVFGVDTEISKEDFDKESIDELETHLYRQAYKHYIVKNKKIQEKSKVVIDRIYEDKAGIYESILIPFTDGKKQIGVSTNLALAKETECKSLLDSMEQLIVLAMIDHGWKEHLREMDELKQEVQSTAHYEQKDPLLIYKFEGFKLFKGFLVSISDEIVSFLSKATIPEIQDQDVQQARKRKQASNRKIKESKAEVNSVLSRGKEEQSAQQDTRENVEVTKPLSTQKIRGRNERVTVKYIDGTIKERVKFKSIEQDVSDNKCILVE